VIDEKGIDATGKIVDWPAWDNYMADKHRKQLSKEKKCITREGLGFTEQISFAEFAEYVIQDSDVAREIGEWLLESYSQEWVANENEPEFIERYTMIDRNELEMQMEGYFFTGDT
jgi:hypothetical protein